MFCTGNLLLQFFALEDFVKACPVGLTDSYQPPPPPPQNKKNKQTKKKPQKTTTTTTTTNALHPLCIFKLCAYISVTSRLSVNMQHVPNPKRLFAIDMLGSTNFDGGQVIRQQLQLGVLFIMPPYLALSVEEALDNCVAFLQILASDCSCLEIYSKLSVWLNLD